MIKGFVEAPSTLNQYAYCWNDPLNLVDLNGLFPCPNPDFENMFSGHETGSNDAIQMSVSGNTVTLDLFVDFRGDRNHEIGNYTARELAIQGFELWAGDYSNVFGHDITLNVNVHERTSSSSSDQNYVTVSISAGYGHTHFRRGHFHWRASRAFTWTPSRPGIVHVYQQHRNSEGEIRTRNYWQFRQAMSHYFGHIFGLGDAYGPGDKPIADMIDDFYTEVMAAGNWSRDMDISNFSIQMLMLAMVTIHTPQKVVRKRGI